MDYEKIYEESQDLDAPLQSVDDGLPVRERSAVQMYEALYREAEENQADDTAGQETTQPVAGQTNTQQTWQTIKNLLRTNEKQLSIVDLNPQNYEELLGGGKKPIATGYNNTKVTMANGSNGGFDLYKKLSSKKDTRSLKAGRTILLDGIRETLENPILVISDHDEDRRPAISYIRSYNYNNDKNQMCKSPLKVIVTLQNIVVSAYFVDYDNIRDLIFNGEKILKQ
jgi:hypothetical protein